MLASLYNGSVCVWNHETQVSSARFAHPTPYLVWIVNVVIMLDVLMLNVNVCATFFQTLVKTFEVCDLPVRASKFVARKNWVITGAVSFPVVM